MSAIGKRGFQAALDLGYGEYLLPKLAPTYRAKFGRDPVAGRNRDGDTARAKARQEKPALGLCSWPACAAPATQRHHVDGWKSSPATCGFCAAHHTAFERAYRAAYTRHRPHARTQEPPTRRRPEHRRRPRRRDPLLTTPRAVGGTDTPAHGAHHRGDTA